MLSSEQLAKLSPAVGQSHKTMSDETPPKPNSLPRSLSLFLPVSFSLTCSFSWILHLNWKLPLFSAERSRCRLKDFSFFFISVRKWTYFWHRQERGLQLSPIESRYSMRVPVLNISLIFFFLHKDAPLYSFASSSTTKHRHLSCSTLQSMKEKQNTK